MNPLISIDGLAGWLAVATPITVLVVVTLSVFLAGTRRAGKTASIDGAMSARDKTEAHAMRVDDLNPGEIVDGLVEAEVPMRPVPEERRTEIAAEIAAAERAGDRSRLMLLLLELASVERDAGDAEAAKVLLRKSIMIANEAGDAVVHAKGRLELGDIAESEGDLTTACEHWQMARAFFLQMVHADEKQRAEERMQRHRCPTDWVLTDF